jgi:hypothetical protein
MRRDLMYWDIFIQDEHLLAGTSVADFITRLLEAIPYQFVQVYELDGTIASRLVSALMDEERAIAMPVFLDIIRQGVQIEWGTFCLSEEVKAFPQAEDYRARALACLDNGETIVRCVDNYLFEVFSRREDLAVFLQNNYQCLSVTQVDRHSIVWSA